MKRLKLEDFKLKNLKENKQTEVDQLLGQVLGNCHDDSDASGIIRTGDGTATIRSDRGTID